ncbi:CC_3452 family protein [Brevundimonas sp.]|uniref:CC_3452 family protein n=1 Tax=Brevundimonas sp. TaxID=1871086 RepID=UPI002ED82D0D
MLLMTLISATLAVAQPAPRVDAAATLAAPGEARRAVLDGRSWSCGPDGACFARGAGASQPALRECRRFVARFGPVSRYARDGVALTGPELAQCNAAAR